MSPSTLVFTRPDVLHCPCRAPCRRSLVLADPWQPTVTLPTQALGQLTYLSFLAEGLLMTNLASQFCEALVKLKHLEELQLSRLQVSSSAAQMLAQALTELPCLSKLVLTGGAAPMHAPELYVLLNGGSFCSLAPPSCLGVLRGDSCWSLQSASKIGWCGRSSFTVWWHHVSDSRERVGTQLPFCAL